MREYQAYVIGADGHTRQRIDLACADDPANLKPGDSDKPPGKTALVLLDELFRMNVSILRGTTTRRLSGKLLSRLNIHSLRRTAATISRNEK
jgi:hypothetical protein